MASFVNSERQPVGNPEDAFANEQEFLEQFGTKAEGKSFSESAVLRQKFSFSFADLSLLANKCLNGDARALSGLDNNVITPSANRSREALGLPISEQAVAPAEEGSGQDKFIRITEVNNYPGPGDISQGVDGEPVDGRMQLEGPDGQVLPNERVVSNALFDQGTAFMPEQGGWNNMFMGSGQYIDHGMTFLNKGGQGSFKIPLPQDDPLYGLMPGAQELGLLPRGTSINTTPGEGEYMNTVTGWIDQNQLYGSDEVIHGFLRVKDANGNMTAKMLSNQYSFANGYENAGKLGDLPTFYDVLVNNGADPEALNKVLRDPVYDMAHDALTEWDKKVRAGDRSVTGSPEADGMMGYIKDLAASIGDLKEAAGEAWVDPGTPLPGSNQQLLGDASHLAKFSALSLAEHKIAGDLRANENSQLAAFHTVFGRFHNDTVEAIIEGLDRLPESAATTPGLEQLAALKQSLNTVEGQAAVFDMARTVLNAGYQRMVYDQYVVALAGGIPFGMSPERADALMPDTNKITPQPINVNEHGYNGYQPEVRPSIGLEFSTAGFRVGHSQIYEELNGITVKEVGEIIKINDVYTKSLIEAFIQPATLKELGGPAGVLAQNAMDRAQAVDTLMVPAVRDMLVGRINDLAAYNMARGNELGIPTLQEFRQNISNLFEATGVGNALGAEASDVSSGLYEDGSNENIFAQRLAPYTSWGDFGDHLRDRTLLPLFMELYGGENAAEDNDTGLINVPLWVGGLAEKETETPTGEGNLPSLMGTTFTFIVQETFDRMQDPDLHYYKIDIPGTDILKQLGFQTFTPMIQTALDLEAQLIHQDTFRTFQLDTLREGARDFTAPEEEDFDGRGFNRLIIGNAKDNTIVGSDAAESSDDIRAGAGNDTVDGGKGEDWIYGQAGDDTLSGGNDNELDHIFGGDGDDTLFADNGSEDALFGEKGADLLIRGNTGGMSDGGLGNDVLLGGSGDDQLHGDSGAEDAENPEGDDIIFGDKGDDEIKGGGGDDLLVAGESGALGDTIYGDSIAVRNAELLARAIRDDQGNIVGTVAPLKSDLGYGVTVGGVNPLTNQLFTPAELAEFKQYIADLRVAPDLNDPANRGPVPVMVTMPYTGPTGNDTIYTGSLADAISALGGSASIDAVMDWLSENEAEAEGAEVEAEAAGAELEAEAEGAELEAEAEGAEVEAEAEGAPLDLVFADGGDDTIYTDGEVSTMVFGGQGTDTLNTSLRDAEQHLDVASLNSYGADGVVTDDSGISDRFYSIERVTMSASGKNSVTINEPEAPVTIDFNAAHQGSNVKISGANASDQSLIIDNASIFDLTGSSSDRIRLGGKLDYDYALDSNKDDDNHVISFDGKKLTVSGVQTGNNVTVKDAEWVEYNYQDTENSSDGVVSEFYYKEFAEKALNLGLSIVKEPVFSGDQSHELVIREFGNQAEHDSKFYLAVSAESLRDASITTLDFTINLGPAFNDVFDLDDSSIYFSDDLDVQRRIEVTRDENGKAQSIRFAGADLETKISSQQAVAYIGLELRGDIESLIKADRSEDSYGLMNKENFSVPLTFSADANVDSVVWDDLYSLRDVGGQYAMLNPELNVVARSAEAKLTAAGSFDLGTLRQIRKEGVGEVTNLVRHGDTIMQSNTWQNDGEFTFVDLNLEAISSDAVDVAVQFANGSQFLSDLGWSDLPGEGSVASVDTTFVVTGEAGQVIDTRDAGYKLEAHGDYMWDTTKIDQFQTKHLITFQGDLNYDGRVGMKDLAYLEVGMRSTGGTVPHDVDANFDNKIDILDLSIIDKDWNKSIHKDFAGSSNISMAELFEQNGRSWDSSNFAHQNQIESGLLHEVSKGHERTFLDELSGDSGVSAAGLDASVVALFEEQNQQYALTSV